MASEQSHADGNPEPTETADESADEPTGPRESFDRTDPQYYLNRELSELEFQKRVLNEATDERNPLLERVKFLSIFTTNMDEFFRKRVGGLKQQIEAGVGERTPDGRTPREQWTEVLETARPMFERQTDCYHETVRPALADAGIRILDYEELSAGERRDLREYFESSVLPTLTPLTFDPAHPFPHISNLSLSLAVLTREDPDSDLTFSRVKVPQNQPRLVRVSRRAVGDTDDPGYYVGSADWMTRNLDNRVEAVAPIEDPRLQDRLDRVLATLLSDNRRRWKMASDGSYEKIRPEDGEEVRNAQATFMRDAEAALENRDGNSR